MRPQSLQHWMQAYDSRYGFSKNGQKGIPPLISAKDEKVEKLCKCIYNKDFKFSNILVRDKSKKQKDLDVFLMFSKFLKESKFLKFLKYVGTRARARLVFGRAISYSYASSGIYHRTRKSVPTGTHGAFCHRWGICANWVFSPKTSLPFLPLVYIILLMRQIMHKPLITKEIEYVR